MGGGDLSELVGDRVVRRGDIGGPCGLDRDCLRSEPTDETLQLA